MHILSHKKDLQIFLDTNVEIQALVGILGRDGVAALINALVCITLVVRRVLIVCLQINTSPDARQCQLPPHAHRTCNNDDPCDWSCDDHYVRAEEKCVCPQPFISCNGICGLFSQVGVFLAERSSLRYIFIPDVGLSLCCPKVFKGTPVF